MQESIFDKLDFGPLKPLLDNDDITDISYSNGGQIWIRSLTQGSLRVEIPSCTQEFMEKLAFQCSNVMGTTFNNAKPFLDAESSELRLNFVHDSIATNGVACVIRKTPAKIRLEKEKLLKEDYFTADIHDVLIKCVQGHCNIIVAGETGSGKTEFVKYLASHTKENEKIITIEDTLELHLDKIFPHRDIVAMKTNNVASYSDVLVTCMRQNPKWILLSEVRSAEAVTAVRNSISSGHNILSTIHADKASAIPYRLYSLMETDLDVDQFLTTIYRYVQLGVHIKAYYSKEYGKFHRELDEVVEFYVDENNVPRSHTIYRKIFGKAPIMSKPSPHLMEYLENQNINISDIVDHLEGDALNSEEESESEGDSAFDHSSIDGESLPTENVDESNTADLSPVRGEQVVDSSVEQNVATSIDTTVSEDKVSNPVTDVSSQNVPVDVNMPTVQTPIDGSMHTDNGVLNPMEVSSPSIDTAAVVSSVGGNMVNPNMGVNVPIDLDSQNINNTMVSAVPAGTYQVQGAISPTIDEQMINNHVFTNSIPSQVDGASMVNQENPNSSASVPSYTADIGQPILPNIDPNSIVQVGNLNPTYMAQSEIPNQN